MKRIFLLLLALVLLCPAALGEEDDDPPYDWRADWEESGYDQYADVQDDTLIVFEGVTALGEARKYRWDSELGTDVKIEPKFENGPRFLDLMFDASCPPHQVSLPSTLRYLGIESFCLFDFTSFTLPEQLEVLESNAFVYCNFNVLRIESTLPAQELLNSFYDCMVVTYEVPEDHPLYQAIDGVLFSKDGKTLLAYPGGRTDEHYDVPAGVEYIWPYAFGTDYLKTISLPIGLKTIGNGAFSDCGRLQSIAIPLTVTEIGDYAFWGCVSLELVSLPDGLTINKDINSKYVQYYTDDFIYRGDNGDTLSSGH
mgnify:FL=1